MFYTKQDDGFDAEYGVKVDSDVCVHLNALDVLNQEVVRLVLDDVNPYVVAEFLVAVELDVSFVHFWLD